MKLSLFALSSSASSAPRSAGNENQHGVFALFAEFEECFHDHFFFAEVRARTDDDRRGAGREDLGEIGKFEVVRHALVEFDVSADADAVRHVGRNHEVAFPVGLGLHADCVEAAQKRREEEAETAVSVHRVVGHARIDERERNAASFCNVQQVRPDLRLKNDESGGLNQIESAADEREKVDGAEDDFYAVGHFLLRDFLCGRGGG